MTKIVTSSVLPLLSYDQTYGTVYVDLRHGSCADGRMVSETVYVDYDAEGRALGVEFLGVQHGVSLAGVPDHEVIADLLTRAGITILDECRDASQDAQ